MRLLEAGEEPSVAEIAAAAEVSRRTVYLYFPTLDQLLVDATLGLLSEAEGERPAGGDEGPEEQVATLAREVQTMSPEVERLGRRIIALTVASAEEADGEGPRRGYRRVEWIEAALEPLRARLGSAAFERLVTALAMVIGFEAVLVQRDVRGLSPEQGADASAWAARVLVRAALAEAEEQLGAPDQGAGGRRSTGGVGNA